ncbi:hypothetical protein BDR06DRAFT_982913 [Suillus hirtellus]|nr:hypothetical protein BDR06DRAFT_982913 [Suillus hirtellus]
MYVPRNFDIQGAKLSKITQKLAYKAIANQNHLEYKRTTLSLLDLTRYAVEHKDISKKIQMFLYKTLNNAYCIGEFWSKIPTYEHRAICQLCQNETDSMEHILINCRDPTKKTIWELTKRLWLEKYGPWPVPHIGLILDINNNKPTTGASHLLKILISESAHLIWTMRHDRIINSNTHTETTTKSRWYNTINKRLQLDRVITSKTKRNTKSANSVKTTWSDVIDVDPQHPQHNWMTNLEVLVGIGLPRPLQTMGTR